jgi:hypothetical protein
MDRGTTAWDRVSSYLARVASTVSRRNALLLVGGLSGACLSAVIFAPAVVALALAGGVAAAWCVWLEKHAEGPAPAEPCNADGSGSLTRPGVTSEGPGVASVHAPASPAKTVARLAVAAACLSLPGTSAHGQTAVDPSASRAVSSSQEVPPPPPQDANPWRNLKFGATLEGYYQYSWNRPSDRTLVLRAYDTRSNTFAIQQSNERFFPGQLGPSDLRGHQNTVLIGGVWWVGNKAGAW